MVPKSQQNGADVERSYAGMLERVSMAGIAASIVAYLLYVLHIVPSSVPVHEIAANWHLGAGELAERGLVVEGWSWIAGLPASDTLSLASIGLLTMTPVACLATASVSFLLRKDYAYALIAFLQIVVLLVAVSGVFTS
ncbi:MAG: DUF1634 domain-containing protein [Prosthecochloris sp.]|nr:DUF1634 domain-containing protein [Prosthecochloris sp.]